MDKARFDGVVAYLAGLYNRELSHLQRAAGWKMLADLPAAAVEQAVSAIAESGRETLPPWPMIFRAASSLADAERQRQPELPAGDSLSDYEHHAVLIGLRAKQTPEQRRRADRVTSEAKGLPIKARLLVARDLLTGTNARLVGTLWDRMFDETLAREFQLHAPLVPRVRADIDS